MMLDILTTIVLGELLLVGWLLAGGLLLARLWSGGKARRAARRLVELVMAQQESRSARLREILVDRHAYSEDRAKQVSAEIDRKEKAFYQAFINIYLERDNAAIAGINVPFENVVDAYRDLLPESASTRPAEEYEEPLMSNAELGRLQADLASATADKERLGEELGLTMETMGRMLNEYSNMAEDNDGSEVDRGKILSMFQEKEDDDIAVTDEELEAVGESLDTSDTSVSQDATPEADNIDLEASVSDEGALDGPVEDITELSIDDLEIAVAEVDEGEEAAGEIPLDKLADLELDGDLGPEKPEREGEEQEQEHLDAVVSS